MGVLVAEALPSVAETLPPGCEAPARFLRKQSQLRGLEFVTISFQESPCNKQFFTLPAILREASSFLYQTTLSNVVVYIPGGVKNLSESETRG